MLVFPYKKGVLNMAGAIAKLGVTLTFDNVATVTLYEGDLVKGLKYTVNGVESSLDGRVRVIRAVTRANSTVPSTCPPEPYVSQYITATALVIDVSEQYDADLVAVQINQITGIDSVNDVEANFVIDGKPFATLEDAVNAASAGSTITLTKDMPAENVGTSVNNGIYKLKDGVTFDGGGHTITVDEATAAGSASSQAGHIFEVSAGTATIQNVNIVGCAKTKAGIVAFGKDTVVNIKNCDIVNCGTVAVQVAGATVVAENLTTAGSPWGAVNVDKGSDDSIPHFTFLSGEMEEKVEIYSEITDQDVVVAEGFRRVIGVGTTLKGFVYYTSDMSRLGVLYGVKDNVTYVYETQGDADKDTSISEKFPTA